MAHFRFILPGLLGCCIAVAAAGCFDPDYSVGAFTCNDGDDCPSGYSCHKRKGKDNICVEDGTTLDLGVKPDLRDAAADGLADGPKPDQAMSDAPRPDRLAADLPMADLPAADMRARDLNQLDKAAPDKQVPDQAVPDLKVPDQKAPLPDLAPQDQAPPKPDKTPGPPVVTPLYPAGAGTVYVSAWVINFTFNVKSATKVASCELFLDSKKVKTKAGPITQSGNVVISYANSAMSEGSHSWYVRCVNSAGWSAKNNTYFTYVVQKIYNCSVAWNANTRYRLMSDITQTKAGDCLVINKDNVLLDGNKKVIKSTRYRDVIYHQGTTTAHTVSRNGSATTKPGGPWVNGAGGQEQHLPLFTVGDVDGDGLVDLVTTAIKAQSRVFRAKGGGAFDSAKPTSLLLTGSNVAYRNPRLLDFDRDGIKDLWLAGGGGASQLYQGNGKGGFAPLYSAKGGIETRHLDLGDFNGDHKIDLVASNLYLGAAMPGNYHVELNDSKIGKSLSFTTGWSKSAPARGHRAIVAELTGDNKWDLVLGEKVGTTTGLYIYKNDTIAGSATLNFGTKYVLSMGAALPLDALDINGDGWTDIVLYWTSKTTGEILSIGFLINNKKGGFSAISASVLPGSGIRFARVADFDDDGFPDLLVATKSQSKPLELYLNKIVSSNAFVLAHTTTSPGLVNGLSIRDLDNDGDLDVVGSHSYISGTSTLQRINFHTYIASSKTLTQTTAKQGSGSEPYAAAIMGNLWDNPASGVRILAGSNGVEIKNLSGVMGFHTGVSVEAESAVLADVVVHDPQLYGVRVASSVTKGPRMSNVTVKNQVQGVGLSLEGGSSTMNNTNLCHGTSHPRFSPVSLQCLGSATVVGTKGNRVRLNNGCGSVTYTPCR